MNTHVTATHLQALLDSSLPDPALILQNGAPTIVGSSEQADEGQAWVIVTRAELREQLPQDRDCSQSDLALTFGLAKDTQVSSIEIDWPSGQKDRFANIQVNQHILVEEGKGIVTAKP